MRMDWTDLAAGSADAADGATVEMAGWMASYEPPGAPTPYFLLSPEPQCCAGCVPGDPAACVEVFASAPLPFLAQALRLRGRWSVSRKDGAWRYRLLDASPLGPPAPRLTRRGVLAGGPLLCLAAASPAASQPDRSAEARALLARMAAIDMHTHDGSIGGVRRMREQAPFTDVAGPMRAGGMAAICLAIVDDAPTHRFDPADRRIRPYRDPAPGELYEWSRKAFARAHAMAADQGMAVITDAAGLRAARSGTPSVVIASEGADFTEGDPDRVDEALGKWRLRHLQLTHYRVNELGDIQTEPPVHGGLTDAGAAVVRRCNALGVVVDVAHGTFDLVKRAAAVTSKPLILSHTSLADPPKPLSRLISPDHARAVAQTGGVVGVWPSQSRFPDLAAMAEGMKRMADVVGVDHVGLGSDMMGLVGPSVFSSYAQTADLAAALLGAGFGAEEAGKILGGNYLRVFEATLG